MAFASLHRVLADVVFPSMLWQIVLLLPFCWEEINCTNYYNPHIVARSFNIHASISKFAIIMTEILVWMWGGRSPSTRDFSFMTFSFLSNCARRTKRRCWYKKWKVTMQNVMPALNKWRLHTHTHQPNSFQLRKCFYATADVRQTRGLLMKRSQKWVHTQSVVLRNSLALSSPSNMPRLSLCRNFGGGKKCLQVNCQHCVRSKEATFSSVLIFLWINSVILRSTFI